MCVFCVRVYIFPPPSIHLVLKTSKENKAVLILERSEVHFSLDSIKKRSLKKIKCEHVYMEKAYIFSLKPNGRPRKKSFRMLVR